MISLLRHLFPHRVRKVQRIPSDLWLPVEIHAYAEPGKFEGFHAAPRYWLKDGKGKPIAEFHRADLALFLKDLLNSSVSRPKT